MKLRTILENHHYQIVNVEHDLTSDKAHGTSKQGTIKAPYQKLEQLFGKPRSYTHDHDTAHEWIVQFHYVDPLREDPEDVETVVVTIYDRFNHGDPSDIDEWTVGGNDRRAQWVLMDYLEQR